MTKKNKEGPEVLTEKRIRELIPDILDKIKSPASKADIVEYIEKHIPLCKEDMEKSKSRNEPKWYQRVGNIVSHTKSDKVFIEFEEGFFLYKLPDGNRKTKYLFSSTDIEEKEDEPSNIVQYSDAKEKRKRTKRKRVARHTNWDLKHEANKIIGEAGEKYVYEKEKEYARTLGPEFEEKVKWVSKENGDGDGYDILSINHNSPNESLYIEVKTTVKDNPLESLYMSSNEIDFLTEAEKDRKGSAMVYRLHSPTENYKKFQVWELTIPELLTQFQLKAQTYRLTAKRIS